MPIRSTNSRFPALAGLVCALLLTAALASAQTGVPTDRSSSVGRETPGGNSNTNAGGSGVSDTSRSRSRNPLSAHRLGPLLDLGPGQHHYAGSSGLPGQVQRAEQPDQLGANLDYALAYPLHRLRAHAHDRGLCRPGGRDRQGHRQRQRAGRLLQHGFRAPGKRRGAFPCALSGALHGAADRSAHEAARGSGPGRAASGHIASRTAHRIRLRQVSA